jgi:hypothetical protein
VGKCLVGKGCPPRTEQGEGKSHRVHLVLYCFALLPLFCFYTKDLESEVYMVVQFTNAKVLGNVRLGNLIAIFCKRHFLGYSEIMVIASSGVTVKLVIHVDKTNVNIKQQQDNTPFEIRGANCVNCKSYRDTKL